MKWISLVALAASLLGTVALAQSGPAVHKPVVSIDDIQDLANTGQAAVLREMIETTVVNTGKFRIMERGQQGMGALVNEQNLAKQGMVTSNTPGKMGGFEGVDFKVYGTITTAGASTSRDVGASSAMKVGGAMARSLGGMFGGAVGNTMSANSDCSQSSASLAVDIRITDAGTGELRYAKHVTQSDRSGTTCGGGGSQVDTSGLMRRAAERVSMGLVTMSYPVKVIDVDDDGKILLNYGEGLLEPGDVFALFTEGKEIVDPDTGAVLGHKEGLLGLVQIAEVTPKYSKATMITPFAAPPAAGSVAREATPEQMRMIPAAKRR
jgi:curli biogenesis system outer membrane secretion channel CsgG